MILEYRILIISTFCLQGADLSDREDDRSKSDPFKRLDMNLDEWVIKIHLM